MITYSVTVTKVHDNGQAAVILQHDHPIYEGYTIKGRVAALPIAGERWVVLRTERNGEPVLGLFQTSEVQAVWHDSAARRVVFETEFSRYEVHYVLDESEPSQLG